MDISEYIKKKYGNREHSLIITLKRYFSEESIDVVEPVKKKWQKILKREDFLERSFDELYSSLIETNTKEKPNEWDEFLIKKVYLAVTIGFLLAIINNPGKKKFRELATSGTLLLYLQDIKLPIFDEYMQEYIIPSFDERAEKGLRSIVLLLVDELIAKDWLELLKDCYSSVNLSIEKDQLSEELIEYYFTKKDELSEKIDNYIEKLYK